MTTGNAPIVIGVGEEFLHDDGVGPAVVAELRRLAAAGRVPREVRLTTAFGEPTELIELWRGAELAIVVDAAAADPQAGLVAGETMRWEVATGMEAPDVPLIAPNPTATHALGPGAAIALAGVLDRLPGRLVLFAVVGADFSLGPGLSAPVAAAVRRVARDIATELAREGPSARSEGVLPSWAGTGAQSRLNT